MIYLPVHLVYTSYIYIPVQKISIACTNSYASQQISMFIHTDNTAILLAYKSSRTRSQAGEYIRTHVFTNTRVHLHRCTIMCRNTHTNTHTRAPIWTHSHNRAYSNRQRSQPSLDNACVSAGIARGNMLGIRPSMSFTRDLCDQVSNKSSILLQQYMRCRRFSFSSISDTSSAHIDIY